ncbi:hypothetical protein KAW64_01385, partial [bacterium]|nr:hypothetical protein [bacterium]
LSLRYRAPVLTKQGVQDQCVPGGTGLLEKSNDGTCVTGIKKHETRDTLVVRLYNLTGSAVDETLRFGVDVTEAWLTDLLEDRLSSLPMNNPRELSLQLGPHEIATVEIGFSESDASENRSRDE